MSVWWCVVGLCVVLGVVAWAPWDDPSGGDDSGEDLVPPTVRATLRRPMPPVPVRATAWAVSPNETRAHLVGTSRSQGLCGHRLRGVWTFLALRPVVVRRSSCEACVAVADVAVPLSGGLRMPVAPPAVESAGRHAADGPTQVITENVVVTRIERRLNVAVPGSAYLPGTTDHGTGGLGCAA